MTAILTSTLEEALRLNAEFGWAPIPTVPELKKPVRRGLFDNPPTTEAEIRLAWQRALEWMNNPANPDHVALSGLQPGLAIHLGESGIFLSDTDTPEEVTEFEALCAAGGYDPGLPSVRTAGALHRDGTVKHVDGRHWYYACPTELVIPRGGELNLRISAPGRPGVFLQGGKRIAMRPPTVRNGKAYLPGGGAELRPMPDFLRLFIEAHLAQKAGAEAARGTRPATARVSDAETAWAERTPILDLLPGWRATGMDGDCEVLAHPDASSERSGVAHATGCSHLPESDTPLLTLFTTSLVDWMEPLLERESPITVTKMTLFALRHYGGDTGAARRALGFHGYTAVRRRETAGASAAPTGPGLGALLAAAGFTTAAVQATVAPTAPEVPAPVAPTPAPAPAPEPTAEYRVPPAPAYVAPPAPAYVAPPAPAPVEAVPATGAGGIPRHPNPAAPTTWGAPRMPSPHFEAAVQTLRNRAVYPADIVEARLRRLLDGGTGKWQRADDLKALHSTPPHLLVAEAATAWGISPAAALPLLRLAGLSLRGEVLVLERPGAADEHADTLGDPELRVPGRLDPLAYREDPADKKRVCRAARCEFTAFYLFHTTLGGN